MNNIIHTFHNDLGTKIILPTNHQFYSKFITRPEKEIGLRKIHAYLIDNHLINGNILDCGAWIGDNSIPWATITKNIIYAIDPSSENCNFIKLLAEINNINNIRVYEMGLSKSNTKISTNYNINHAPFQYGTDGANIVDSVSIDYLHESKMIENLSCIHLDVEGMEYDVIIGGINTIKKYKPIISFEQHLETDNYLGLIDYLNKLDYESYLINEILPECRHDCRNFLSVPRNINFDETIPEIETYCQIKNILVRIDNAKNN